LASTDECIQWRTLKLVLQKLATMPLTMTPPEVAQAVYELVYTTTANADPYAELKHYSNRLALALYPSLKETIAASENPLLTACKLAISGNSIDFGPQAQYGDLDTVVASALGSSVAINHFERFRQAMQRATRVLYLGDNAGEILFDRVLIEQLNFHFQADITYVVRDRPIINDATMEDAVFVGLTDIVNVVSNGSGAPGTVLNQCSAQLQQLYKSSDVIIAKGQGNFESLSGESKRIFYFLKAKCSLVSKQLKVKLGDLILLDTVKNH